VDDNEFNAEKAVKILNHPIRIKIIQLLGAKGPMKWKELSKEVGSATGALYHHLDSLERVVTRDASKRYMLTKFGEELNLYLASHSSPRDSVGLDQLIKRRTAGSVARGVFVPRTLIHTLTSSRPKALATAAGGAAIVAVAMVAARSQTILFSFTPSRDIFQSTVVLAASITVLTSIMYAGTILARARGDPIILLASATIALLPLTALALFLRALAATGNLGVLANGTAVTILLALFQAWAAGIASAGISVASGLRFEKALLVSLAMIYLTASVMLVFASRFI
jgi:Bacterial regulatory protein, arsR family